MEKTSPSILVVGPSWVGDMVLAQSLFIALKKKYPQGNIDVLAPEWSLPVLRRMPQVRQGIGLPVGHQQLGLGVRFRIARKLRALKYDQAIVLPRSFKAALVPFLAGIPVRTGFRGEWRYGLINDRRPLDRKFLDQTVKRFVALGLDKNENQPVQCAYPRLQSNPEIALKLLTKFSLHKNNPLIGLMPGAEYGPAKQWPLEYFSALVKELDAQGMQAWILGSAKDHPAAQEIIKNAQVKGVNLCGKTSLEEVIDLISLLDVAVSNDSGLMHIASAVNVPIVAIYGSSSPNYTPPMTDKAKILYRDLDCSPCFQRQCPLKHLNCLREITPDSVMDRIKSVLMLNKN